MKKWEEFEEHIAELTEGKRQPGSGNSPIACKKGDIKCDDYMIECKFTEGKSYRLSSATWEKIVFESLNDFKIPLFACRSQAGDFFVGSVLDFSMNVDLPYLGEKKSIAIDREGTFDLKGDYGNKRLVAWRIDGNSVSVTFG